MVRISLGGRFERDRHVVQRNAAAAVTYPRKESGNKGILGKKRGAISVMSLLNGELRTAARKSTIETRLNC